MQHRAICSLHIVDTVVTVDTADMVNTVDTIDMVYAVDKAYTYID